MWFVVCVFITGLNAVSASAASGGTLVTPDAAPPGATVSIGGKGFGPFRSTQENRVLFNGIPALIQQWERDLVVAKVPLRATDGPVEVWRGKKKIAAGHFTVETPTIDAVTPSKAEPGSIVQINGSHFGNTAGSKDPNTMFGVNEVLISGVPAKIRRWRNDKIEVEIPANAVSGPIVVRLASSDPLPDGSCCAPVQYRVSNPQDVDVIPAVRIDPLSGPVGTKVVLFGKGFGRQAPGDAILFNDQPAAIAQWTDVLIVAHVPLNATTGPLIVKRGDTERALGEFTVRVPTAIGLSPAEAPIGSLVKITGKHFGIYSESGSTPFAFADFNKGENTVEFGGVPGIIYRWHNDRIDVWVPYSAKSGPVIVRRGGTVPKPDGSCCAERGLVSVEAGTFTVMIPRVDSFSPSSAGLDDIVTIKGEHFGNFLKTTEATQPGLNEAGHDFIPIQLRENVSRSEVLFNTVAAIIVSWTDTEIQARVPRRHAFGIATPNEFLADTATGPLIVRRGSWDLLPEGTCCTPKRWVTVEAGQFTVQAKGLPEQGYFNDTAPLRVD